VSVTAVKRAKSIKRGENEKNQLAGITEAMGMKLGQ